jgi:DNA polymerase-3 subunit epsilon
VTGGHPERDRPLGELGARARALGSRLLGREPPAGDPALRARCLALDRRALLATPIAEARFVALDLETTGLAAYGGDAIVQVALLEYRGLEPTGRELCSLVRPPVPIPPGATEIHGIDDEMVRDAPTIETLVDQIIAFLDGAVIVGHHVTFDVRFLNRVLLRVLHCRLPHPLVDTMLLYLSRTGRLGHHDLGEVAEACGVSTRGRHDARGDAAIAAGILARLAGPAAEAGGSVRQLIAGTRAGAPDAPTGPPG